MSQALLARIVDRDKLFLLNESCMNTSPNLSATYVKIAITELLHNLQESFFFIFSEQKMWLSPQNAKLQSLAQH